MTKNDNSLLPNIVSLTKKFIAIPSIHNNPDALWEILAIAKKELQGNFIIEEFEKDNTQSILVHNAPKKTNHFRVILNAHLDVIPGNETQYIPIERDGKIFGRGAFDMKGATASMIWVFKNIAKKVNYPLALQIVTDEEMYSRNTTQYQIAKGVRGKFVIAGENSNFHIKNQAKGVLWIKITAKGGKAHGAYPWKGNNALWRLLAVLEKIREMYPELKREEWKTTINLAKIETPNTAFNSIPDIATAYLDVRYIPGEKTIEQTLRQYIPNDIQMEIVLTENSVYTKHENMDVQGLKDAIEKVTKKPAVIDAAHGTSDIRFYNNVGYDGVEFGPIGANQHADKEWVSIKSLEDYYHILRNFLLSLA